MAFDNTELIFPKLDRKKSGSWRLDYNRVPVDNFKLSKFINYWLAIGFWTLILKSAYYRFGNRILKLIHVCFNFYYFNCPWYNWTNSIKFSVKYFVYL